MLSVLEMIFRCIHCDTPRQFGTGESLNDKPDNPLPMINCARCNRVTEHRFEKVQHRTDSRERKLRAEMKPDLLYGAN